MNIGNQIDKNNTLQSNKRELNNLREKHGLEIEKLKTNHDKQKNQIRMSHDLENLAIHSDHQRKMAQKVQRNESTYKNLQDSLDNVKNQTDKEKERILKLNEEKLMLEKIKSEDAIASTKLDAQLIIDDVSHQARLEQQRISKEINNKENELKSSENREISSIKQDALATKEMDKTKYYKERLVENEKFYNAMQRTKITNQKEIANEERKYQKQMETKSNIYETNIEKLTNTQTKRQTDLNKQFETKYENNFMKNSNLMQKLVGKKEQIMNRLRGELTIEANKEFERSKDSFYHFTDLAPTIDDNKQDKKYVVSISVPKHEVDKVKLTAYNREVKVSMDRDYDFTRVDEDGSKDTVKKTESYITKIPVDDIVNSKKISKSYKDGMLIFEIEKA